MKEDIVYTSLALLLAVACLVRGYIWGQSSVLSANKAYFYIKDHCSGTVQVVETSDQEIGFECVGYIASSTSSARLKN